MKDETKTIRIGKKLHSRLKTIASKRNLKLEKYTESVIKIGLVNEPEVNHQAK